MLTAIINFLRNPVVRIEFPALDRLIDWLREQDTTAATIAELTAEVEQLNAALRPPSTALQEAVDNNQPQ